MKSRLASVPAAIFRIKRCRIWRVGSTIARLTWVTFVWMTGLTRPHVRRRTQELVEVDGTPKARLELVEVQT